MIEKFDKHEEMKPKLNLDRWMDGLKLYKFFDNRNRKYIRR